MNAGALFAFSAYFAFAVSDVAVKALGATSLSPFEITFFGSLFCGLAMLALRPHGERWRDVFRMNNPRITLLRSVSGVCAGVFGVAAVITVPLAEAYALIFMAPFLVTLLSLLLLRERPTWLGIVATIVGFAGVLMVVRPGLRALEFGHLYAALAAFFVALSTILIRRVAATEKRTSLLMMPQIVTVAVSGTVMTTQWVPPSATDVGLLALSGGVGALAQFLLILAARRVQATTIGQAQFSQLIWAVLAGALIFREYPDLLSFSGIAVIAVGGLLTLRDRNVLVPPPGPSRR